MPATGAVAGLSMDGSNNNIEVIDIPGSLRGNRVVDIVGSNVSEGPQDCALVYIAHTWEMPATDVVRVGGSVVLDIPDNVL